MIREIILKTVGLSKESKLREVKEKAKKRDNHTCQVCGSANDLDVHHLFDASTHPELELKLDNLVTVCHTCHYRDFHIDFKGGTDKPTTKWDFIRFLQTHQERKNKN